MLDLKFVVANHETVKQNCRNRNAPADVLTDVDLVVALETERRGLLREVEEIRRRQNEVAQATGRERDPQHRTALIDEGKRLKSSVADLEERLRRLEAELNQRLRRIPNLTHPGVAPIGLTEDVEPRKVRRGCRHSSRFADFQSKDHVELGKALDFIDFRNRRQSQRDLGFVSTSRTTPFLLDLALQRFALHEN